MESYSLAPLYLVERLATSDHEMNHMHKAEAEETSQDKIDIDHVVLRVASCSDGSGVETTEVRIAVGDSASCCYSSSSGRARQAENLLQSLTGYYLFYLVGATSVFIPFITGRGAIHMLPWLLNLSGFLSLLQYACVCKSPGSTAIFFLAALHLTTGVWMLAKPAVGETAATYVIEVWFLIHATLKLWISLQVRKLTTRPALFTSGIFSIILTCVLQSLSPNLGLSPVDLYIRIELLSTGFAGALMLYSLITFLQNQKPCK